jgi:hypothetical protein
VEISRELFDRQRRPRFGKSNPERMQFAFWEWMIRGPDRLPTREEEGIHAEFGLMIREGILKSASGPWRARDLFKAPITDGGGPIWTFDRMGRTCTELTDGRTVCVGGEHEDYYDPDFCIYNDVVVFGPNDQIEIFGYPKEVFPSTDFHTATLAGDQIILIGCLGYSDDRRAGHTPVYALHLADFHISSVSTSGEIPGWISDHEAESSAEGIITVRGGKVIGGADGKQRCRRNLEEYTLNLQSRVWQRTTNRNWRQFSVCRKDGKRLGEEPEPESLLSRGIEHTVVPCEEWNGALIVVEGVPISLSVDVSEVQMIVRGNLQGDMATRVMEEIRANLEASIESACILEEL